jgi:hypothetical protein
MFYDPEADALVVDPMEMDEVDQLRELVHNLLYRNTKLSHALAKKRQQIRALRIEVNDIRCKTNQKTTD